MESNLIDKLTKRIMLYAAVFGVDCLLGGGHEDLIPSDRHGPPGNGNV